MMPLNLDEFSAQEQEDAAARIARRMKREDRRHAERRRAALLTLSLAAAGVLLLAVGLSVAAATRDGRAGGSGSEGSSSSVVAQPPLSETPSLSPRPVAASASTTLTDDVPIPQVASPLPAETAARASKAAAVPKSATPARAPTRKKTVSKPPQAGILIRKCGGGGCHSAAEISEARVDRASAIGAIEAMVDAGRVNLTSDERAAVIAALTGK